MIQIFNLLVPHVTDSSWNFCSTFSDFQLLFFLWLLGVSLILCTVQKIRQRFEESLFAYLVSLPLASSMRFLPFDSFFQHLNNMTMYFILSLSHHTVWIPSNDNHRSHQCHSHFFQGWITSSSSLISLLGVCVFFVYFFIDWYLLSDLSLVFIIKLFHRSCNPNFISLTFSGFLAWVGDQDKSSSCIIKSMKGQIK